MNPELDLKELEKKAWLTYFQDGFWDILFGIMMIMGAIRALTDNILFTFLILGGVLVPILGKKYITIPRLGRVRFNPDLRFQKKKLVFVFIVAIMITISFFLIAISNVEPLSGHASPFMALLLVLVLGMLAYFIDYWPLLLYGLMMATIEVFWGIYGVPTGPVIELVFGSTALFIGITMMIRFLRKYPLPNEEELANAP
ncbi:MAG: hypothetical protein JSW00_16665 [Thermoplasmata archaeon]|nr:MAG: hypothetical protein JSW00_16665 [Thermoplasmata archaeon]